MTRHSSPRARPGLPPTSALVCCREAAGLTVEQAAACLGWPAQAVAAIETGHVRPHPTAVEALLDLYSVTGSVTGAERPVLRQLVTSRRHRWRPADPPSPR